MIAQRLPSPISFRFLAATSTRIWLISGYVRPEEAVIRMPREAVGTGLRMLVGGVILITAASCTDTQSPSRRSPRKLSHRSSLEKTQTEVEKFCGTCHQFPPPNCEPSFAWRDIIEGMYKLAERERRWPKTQIPPIEDVIAFYRSRGPDELDFPKSAVGSPRAPLEFAKHSLTVEGPPQDPGVSNVKFVRFSDQGPLQLLICDMRNSFVAVCTPSQPDEPAKIIGQVPHPCHTKVVDLDGDGIRDILVADLGVLWDQDTDKGTVVWLRGQGDGEFESVVLFDGLSRVSDIQPADFDGDGDLDLIVAVFGHVTTGALIYFENYTTDYATPDFDPYVIESRAGAIHVPIVDLNHDGRPDFVTVFAQEHETVAAFLNIGRGRFEKKILYTAPHPRWGSTGLELVDMDRDGDVDVLFSHGDAVEGRPIVRPYHGFGWLENNGTFPFTYHRLARFPGGIIAKVGDLASDGTMGIVSSSFLPLFDPGWSFTNGLDSVIWMQETGAGQFQRYTLETGRMMHATLDLGDYDGDGDTDIAVGNFLLPNSLYLDVRSTVTLWENRTTTSDRSE